jgi:hypothetical protein
MATRSPQPKKPMMTDVDLAVAAVEESGRPLDLDVGDLDTSPTSIGLPAPQEAEPCSHHRYVCAKCGRPLRRTHA